MLLLTPISFFPQLGEDVLRTEGGLALIVGKVYYYFSWYN
jgi:uncharacterized protein YjeT (DUF2065 family)